MLNIGSHISVSDGFHKAAEKIIKIDGNTFQYFTRNPRGGRARKWEYEEIKKLHKLMDENNFVNLLAHSAYTMNLASDKAHVRDFAEELLKDDIKRMEMIERSYLVFHPGSHVGQGADKGIDYIIHALNNILKEDTKTIILLETMSGKGTEIGRDFDELSKIIEGVKYDENLGVCFDTCHVFAAGYDIVNDLDGVLEEFDDKIGIDRLKAIHLNDSLEDLASNKDRHANIGKGFIGFEAIKDIINHKKLRDIPFYLETPNDDLEGYGKEIEILRRNYK